MQHNNWSAQKKELEILTEGIYKKGAGIYGMLDTQDQEDDKGNVTPKEVEAEKEEDSEGFAAFVATKAAEDAEGDHSPVQACTAAIDAIAKGDTSAIEACTAAIDKLSATLEGDEKVAVYEDLRDYIKGGLHGSDVAEDLQDYLKRGLGHSEDGEHAEEENWPAADHDAPEGGIGSRSMDEAEDEEKITNVELGGKVYEVGSPDPKEGGIIVEIEKFANGYMISVGEYDSPEDFVIDPDSATGGYGYALTLDGQDMDEDDLEDGLGHSEDAEGEHEPLEIGGELYEVGSPDPKEGGIIVEIEKFANGYMISAGEYNSPEDFVNDPDSAIGGYGYALTLDGQPMDEDDLKDGLGHEDGEQETLTDMFLRFAERVSALEQGQDVDVDELRLELNGLDEALEGLAASEDAEENDTLKRAADAVEKGDIDKDDEAMIKRNVLKGEDEVVAESYTSGYMS